MNWKRIPKEQTAKPSSGGYTDWKAILAREGFNQCVYCAIPEASFGGFRNYHVEHYRPKSRFPTLVNSFDNLFYACSICNGLKGNDWPNEPSEDYSTPAYPKPSDIDYRELFSVDDATGVVEGGVVAAAYVAERLCLNRPQLLIERRAHVAFRKLAVFEGLVRAVLPKLKDLADRGDTAAAQWLAKICDQLLDLCKLKESYVGLRPYEPQDIRRTA